MAPAHVFVKAGEVLAVVTLVLALAACKSPEQIQREQDQADNARCASMGVAAAPGDPQYVQCRMWAAQMRLQEEQDRRRAWLAALSAMAEMRQMQQPSATRFQAPLYDDEPPPSPHWIVPPPMPQTTWCRPVGRWMSCTGQ